MPEIASFVYEHEDITTPHRHDHYTCFFIESGKMNFNIDFQKLEIPESSILLSSPGQIHQSEVEEELVGWMLAFDAQFIDENARNIIEQSFARVALLHLDIVEKKWFTSIFEIIHSSLKEKPSDTFHSQLIQTLLNALFYKIVAIFQVQEDTRVQEFSSRSIEIVKTFNQLIKKHYITLKRPGDFASKMNITVSYLNDTVKSVTGFPATYFIQQEIFQEAQRLLFYTNKSIKEIAYELGYEDYKYFIRLFTKTVGISPSTFRNHHQSAHS
ncbi:helix-turn-helix domain-containing protein [Emticicia fontis]